MIAWLLKFSEAVLKLVWNILITDFTIKVLPGLSLNIVPIFYETFFIALFHN